MANDCSIHHLSLQQLKALHSRGKSRYLKQIENRIRQMEGAKKKASRRTKAAKV